MQKTKIINAIYYKLKPLMPRWFQLWLRRRVILAKKPLYKDVWPILESAGDKPEKFDAWPDGKDFAVVLTHDVEKQKGHDRCERLMQLEKELGFVSLFNFVPERYKVSPQLRKLLEEQGFEVGVHGLNHDGTLFQSKKIFDERAPKINQYIEEWNVVGFRSPAMHHNLDWIHELDLEYDLSTFDTDPFEPQAEGVGTIFPFWVSKNGKGYVEMPYTIAQDFTPYVLMKEPTIEVWKRKVDWIVKKGGMILVNTHPDYMSLDGKKPGLEEFPVAMYLELLNYIKTEYKDRYWHVLPKELATFWKEKVEQIN
ncbi:hypothetical protein QQ008_28795 [Fulvivirgaceae bacterium BMA10]|uniref:NodB homology domain-containing protein n=1 Tax=Splendidivirga corallicola TaxID=3051826 RepID=A0ABT8KZ77_9BACT|nr:hypothetical protein [Fulvivirgaceae bacterium BMA10]